MSTRNAACRLMNWKHLQNVRIMLRSFEGNRSRIPDGKSVKDVCEYGLKSAQMLALEAVAADEKFKAEHRKY